MFEYNIGTTILHVYFPIISLVRLYSSLHYFLVLLFCDVYYLYILSMVDPEPIIGDNNQGHTYGSR